MKKYLTTITTLVVLFFTGCNNSTPKEELAQPQKDTVAKVSKPAAQYDTIEVYHFKGAEPFINTDYLKSSSEQEKALLAYYCYFFSTACKDTKHCMLTEALGLGEQNSKEHKALVLKWFTDDETVQLAKEGGIDRIKPQTSWYEEIKLVKKESGLIVVRYLSRWKTTGMEGKGVGTDEYQFEANRIKVIGRQHEDI
jgi:hypothetical protein